jgi:hypothetical protein
MPGTIRRIKTILASWRNEVGRFHDGRTRRTRWRLLIDHRNSCNSDELELDADVYQVYLLVLVVAIATVFQ